MSYTLLITLQDRKPISTRSIQIDGQASFAQLAETICHLYGLYGEHLYEFIQKDQLVINHPEIDVEALAALDLGDPEIKELVGEVKQLSARTFHVADYFKTHTQITFSYDFALPRTFLIEKTAEDTAPVAKKIVVLDGKGNYLVEDAGGPAGLKQFLIDYKKRKLDEDRREDRAEFEERITPALTPFDLKKHQK